MTTKKKRVAGEVFLGNFLFGINYFEVYASPRTVGGRFSLISEGGPKIYIGTEDFEDKPYYVLSIALHEIFEALLSLNGYRFIPAPAASRSSSDYVFQFNHEQFNEIIERAAEGLEKLWPVLVDFCEKQKKIKK